MLVGLDIVMLEGATNGTHMDPISIGIRHLLNDMAF